MLNNRAGSPLNTAVGIPDCPSSTGLPDQRSTHRPGCRGSDTDQRRHSEHNLATVGSSRPPAASGVDNFRSRTAWFSNDNAPAIRDTFVLEGHRLLHCKSIRALVSDRDGGWPARQRGDVTFTLMSTVSPIDRACPELAASATIRPWHGPIQTATRLADSTDYCVALRHRRGFLRTPQLSPSGRRSGAAAGTPVITCSLNTFAVGTLMSRSQCISRPASTPGGHTAMTIQANYSGSPNLAPSTDALHSLIVSAPSVTTAVGVRWNLGLGDLKDAPDGIRLLPLAGQTISPGSTSTGSITLSQAVTLSPADTVHGVKGSGLSLFRSRIDNGHHHARLPVAAADLLTLTIGKRPYHHLQATD